MWSGSGREKRLSRERSCSRAWQGGSRCGRVAVTISKLARVPYLGGSAVPSHGGINFSSTRDIPQRLRGNSVRRSPVQLTRPQEPVRRISILAITSCVFPFVPYFPISTLLQNVDKCCRWPYWHRLFYCRWLNAQAILARYSSANTDRVISRFCFFASSNDLIKTLARR